MKTKVISLLAFFSFFSVIAFASPDYNNPATIKGIVYELNDETFYVNGYLLHELTKEQINQLGLLVGKKVTVKGFYEKNYLRYMGPNEVYVKEVKSRWRHPESPN